MNIISLSKFKKHLEKIILYFENLADKKVVRKTDFKKGEDFEEVVKESGIKIL